MAYRIIAFDGLQTPVLRRRGDPANMGTGSAQSDFRQIPGGGFYRMRRTRKSPQGIRPVTDAGVLKGTSASDLRSQIDAWRSKIGVYGKLTVRFHDGSLRWQWAELQDVDIPDAPNGMGDRYAPIGLTWQTAAQHWNGIIQGQTWTWGDSSWVFGDGTASFGQNALSYTLPSATSYTQAVTNAGNIDATNLVLSHTASGARTNWTARNDTTGQTITYTGTIPTGNTLHIDTAAQWARLLGGSKAVSSMSRSGNVLTVNTTAVHGLTTGDDAQIIGGTIYDGQYTDVTVVDTDTFTAAISPEVYAYGTVTDGIVNESTDIFAALTISDEKAWMVLRPGANSLTIISNTNMLSDTLRLNFYDSYA